MQTSLAAVTALAGSLLLAPLMLGPTQAGSAPDLKNAVSAIHDSAIVLVPVSYTHLTLPTIYSV